MKAIFNAALACAGLTVKADEEAVVSGSKSDFIYSICSPAEVWELVSQEALSVGASDTRR